MRMNYDRNNITLTDDEYKVASWEVYKTNLSYKKGFTTR